jgi:hypothetical protein
LHGLLRSLPVGREVVLAAERVVIHPGLVGDGDVDVRRLVAVAGNHAREKAA